MLSKRVCGLVGILLSLTSAACSPTLTTSPPPPSATPVRQIPSVTPPDETPTSILPSPTPERPMAATVNGEPIYLDDYEHELEQYSNSLEAQGVDPNSEEGQEWMGQARDRILTLMIEQVLIRQAAEKAGVTVGEDRVEQTLQDMVAEGGGEDAFRAKLEEWGETYEEFRREVRAQLLGMQMTRRVVAHVPESAEQVRARHILVDTREEAQRIRSQLLAGSDFASLARAHSQDMSTRDSGGDLGFFPPGVLISRGVEEAAFSLRPGQFSEVITSTLGFHIVQVVERDADRAIGADTMELLRERAVREWVERLWSQASIVRSEESAP